MSVPARALRVAVIGAGWAGCAAAVELAGRGHAVTLMEAAREPGGRARAIDAPADPAVDSANSASPPATPARLDNGQHILIGAYSQTLALMRRLGREPQHDLLRLPLALVRPDGQGLALPDWPPPLDALWGIARARGWSWGERLALVRLLARWRAMGFSCPAHWTVQRLCEGLPPAVMAGLIEPLTVSALNTPPERASAAVLLRVLRDALFSGRGGSHLLLPRVDLGQLLPHSAVQWLQARGARHDSGHRVQSLRAQAQAIEVDGEAFDRVVLACGPQSGARLLRDSQGLGDCSAWIACTEALQFLAITTVYLHAPGARLARPMLALDAAAGSPAQFVFDRGQLGGPAGLLAFVISASEGTREELQAQVLAQAAQQLGLAQARPVQTVVEKRATFACTPGLQRPGPRPSLSEPRLVACGDHLQGPYPATLEGAVRSGLEAAALVG